MTRLLCIFLCLVTLSYCLDSNGTETEVKIRSKRFYGGYEYGYGGDDYWYAGRIFGIIIGSLLFLLCCCAPCICLAGVWFLGWFGLRDRRSRRAANKGRQAPPSEAPAMMHQDVPPPLAYTTVSRPREVIVDTAPPPRRDRGDHIIYQAEDRFYSSSAPATENRPYRSSNF